MDVNKLFSIQSNGYSISEVDDYVTFIQTELTKNMKVNRDIQNKNDTLFSDFNQLKSENKKLNEKNLKLYRDCVAFAKRLKALEVYDNSVEISSVEENEVNQSLEELKNAYDILLNENQELKAKLYNATYNTSNKSNDEVYMVDDEIQNKPKTNDETNELIETLEFIEDKSDSTSNAEKVDNNELLENVFETQKETSTETNNKINEPKDESKKSKKDTTPERKSKLKPVDMDDYNNSLIEDDDNDEVEDPKDKKDKNTKDISSGKNTIGRKFLNVFVTILLVISIIVSIGSLLTFAFIKNPDVTFIGYRSYTIVEDNKELGFTKNDIVITKRISPAEIRKGYRVLCKKSDNKNTRKVKLISSVKNVDGKLQFEVTNFKKDKYPEKINKNDIIGKVSTTLPKIGVVTNYAFTNTYDYIAIISSVLFITIFIKVLMSIKKSKSRKIKFDDYDISDFSLDI